MYIYGIFAVRPEESHTHSTYVHDYAQMPVDGWGSSAIKMFTILLHAVGLPRSAGCKMGASVGCTWSGPSGYVSALLHGSSQDQSASRFAG